MTEVKRLFALPELLTFLFSRIFRVQKEILFSLEVHTILINLPLYFQKPAEILPLMYLWKSQT
jgi:hypothetical protein